MIVSKKWGAEAPLVPLIFTLLMVMCTVSVHVYIIPGLYSYGKITSSLKLSMRSGFSSEVILKLFFAIASDIRADLGGGRGAPWD